MRIGGTNPEHRDPDIQGFKQQELWSRGLANREIPKLTWQRGPPNIQWSTGGMKPIDRRFGTWGFDMKRLGTASRDPPRLTFDHRGFGVCSHGDSTVSLAIARGLISRYVKGRLPRRLWVLGLPSGSLEEHRLFGPWSMKVLEERPPVEDWGSRQSGIRAGFHLYIAGEGGQGC